ncbi:hypothetical protein V5O48_003875 [Marasmius crinis-equi]|uniref:RING-type domain-containing protein n=1 Tax=Marasmius crinis-equi TaxID=585013 RepID=A0ABR3FRN8_9AGAR
MSPPQRIWEGPQVKSPTTTAVPPLSAGNVSELTNAEKEKTLVSMVEGLVEDTDSMANENRCSDPDLPLTIYQSPIAFGGPSKPLSLSLNLDTNFRSSTSCTIFDPLGPPTTSVYTPSPDTSSPSGLAALPAVSPLASTPSDITMLNGPTTISSTPEFLAPSNVGLCQTRNNPQRSLPSRRDSASSVETRVDSAENSRALTTLRVNNHWKLYNDAIVSVTPPTGGHSKWKTDSVESGSPHFIDIPIATTISESEPSPSSGESSMQASPAATSPDLSSLSFSTVDMLSMEQELEPPLHQDTVDGNAGELIPRSLVYCRLCGLDPCDDCTATFCGHVYCNGCITRYVMKHSECPVCGSPALLYCLFRLNLT